METPVFFYFYLYLEPSESQFEGYLCAFQIPDHILRKDPHFMFELALMWHSCIYNVLNKDVSRMLYY